MGRDRTHAPDLTPEVADNAHVLIERVNRVLSRAAQDNVLRVYVPSTRPALAAKLPEQWMV